MSSHNAVPGPHQVDPTLVPVPSPAGLPGAEVPVETVRPEWHGGALAPPPGLASGPDVGCLLKGLQRRWWVAMFVGLLLAGGAGTAAYLLLEPPWTAEAKVHIDTVPPWILTRAIDSTGDRDEFVKFERWQAAQMKGRDVLNEVRKRDEVKNLALLREQPDALQFLQDEVKVEYKDGDEMLAVTMTGKDPEAVKTIVKAVREEYFNEIVETQKAGREKRKAGLKKVVDNAQSVLDGHQTTLHRLASNLGVTPHGGLALSQLELRALLRDKQREVSQVQSELNRLRARLKIEEGQAKEITVAPPSEQDLAAALDADPAGHSLVVARDRLKARVAGYEGTVRDPNWFGLVEARRQLRVAEDALEERSAKLRTALGDGLRQKVRADLDGALKALRYEIAFQELQEKVLTPQLTGLQGDKSVLGESSVELERLQALVAEETGRLNQYKNELAKLEIELGPDVPARVISFEDAALLKRDLKKQIVAAAGAPVAMLLLTCFGVGWWESRARRIHTADEVATGLGMRVVGAVPPLANAARLVTVGEQQEDVHVHSLLESIDSIRTVLLRDAHVEATRVIMVTSAVGGEGKTTLASHLASSLARAGRRTLLIDCDLRRPSAHQLFELPLQPGFSEAILGEVHIAEATLSTSVDGLWMIPAGQWDREVLQALARDGLQKLFDKLKKEYDFVIIDSHPVLPATDSLLVGQHVDAVILSVLRGVSQGPKVFAAYQRLALLGIRMFGAVVNGLPEGDVYSGGYQYAAPAPR